MHRDPAGMLGGLDVLYLLGNFDEGGDLFFQYLNVTLEWLPGDLCAFDGKVFSHGVKPWKGNKRHCFIYFVHRNVLSHFGLPSSLPFPHLNEFIEANRVMMGG